MTRAELQQAAVNFGNAHLGSSIDVDNSYGPQCWDWAAYYASQVVGCPSMPTGPVGGARECFEYFRNPLPQYFDRIPNDPNDANQIPLPGDIMCWGDPYGVIDGVHYGHIAVVRDADTGGFTSFDQNWGGQYVRAIRHNWVGVLGWLRPKTSENPVIMEDDMLFKDRPNGRDEIIRTYQVVARRTPSEDEINAHLNNSNMFSLTFGFDAERAAQEQQKADVINGLQNTVNTLQAVVDGDKVSKSETEKQLADAKQALADALEADKVEDATYEAKITELTKGHTTTDGAIPSVVVTRVNAFMKFVNFLTNLLLGSKH